MAPCRPASYRRRGRTTRREHDHGRNRDPRRPGLQGRRPPGVDGGRVGMAEVVRGRRGRGRGPSHHPRAPRAGSAAARRCRPRRRIGLRRTRAQCRRRGGRGRPRHVPRHLRRHARLRRGAGPGRRPGPRGVHRGRHRDRRAGTRPLRRGAEPGRAHVRQRSARSPAPPPRRAAAGRAPGRRGVGNAGQGRLLGAGARDRRSPRHRTPVRRTRTLRARRTGRPGGPRPTSGLRRGGRRHRARRLRAGRPRRVPPGGSGTCAPPISELVASQPATVQDEVWAQVTAAWSPFEGEDGHVRLPCTAVWVAATNPG